MQSMDMEGVNANSSGAMTMSETYRRWIEEEGVILEKERVRKERTHHKDLENGVE